MSDEMRFFFFGARDFLRALEQQPTPTPIESNPLILISLVSNILYFSN